MTRYALCLDDAHLFLIHAATVNFEVGECAVDVRQILRRQLQSLGSDILVKVSSFSGAGIGTMNGFCAKSQASES